MKTVQELYLEKKMSAEEILDRIQSRDYIVCAQAAAEPTALLEKMDHLKTTGVRDVDFVTCVPAQDFPFFHDPEMKGIINRKSWFYSAGERTAHKEGLISFAPQRSQFCLSKGLERAAYEGRRPVLFATVSPMDKHGYMTLSISAIYEMDMIKSGSLVFVEVNPNYPRTFGDTLVHISQVAGLVESDRPIPEAAILPYTETDAAIGKNVASLVEDGSTIQLGIGYIPNAVAHELRNKKHLGIHTEMFTDSMVELIACGLRARLCDMEPSLVLSDDEVLEQIISRTRIARYRLQSGSFALEGARVQGYTGHVDLSIQGPDSLIRLANVLYCFAPWCGVGIKTALGMGGCRIEPIEYGRK